MTRGRDGKESTGWVWCCDYMAVVGLQAEEALDLLPNAALELGLVVAVELAALYGKQHTATLLREARAGALELEH